MITEFFRDAAINMSKKQPVMVDQILRSAPILEMIPMEQSSHGLWHKYEEGDDVQGAGLVDANSPLPEVYSKTGLKQLDLNILGGIQYCPLDSADEFGGAANYFNKKQPRIFAKTGQDAEKSILYNNFRKFAIDNQLAGIDADYGPRAYDAGGSGSANFSMIAIKFVPGEITGLYDAKRGRGFLMDMMRVGEGGIVFYEDSNGNKIPAYAVLYKTRVGIMLANARYVSAICNIDIDTTPATPDLPTASQIDDLLAGIEADSSDTFLYMHPRLKTALNTYKAAALQTLVETENFKRTFTAWNGIPIIGSYNFLNGTETTVSGL